MADITMCYDYEKCEKRKECHRATAIPDYLQSYCSFYKICKETDYNNFWPNNGYKKRDIQ